MTVQTTAASSHSQEMSLDTLGASAAATNKMHIPHPHDRILEIRNMGDHSHNISSVVSFTQPLFRANPSEIVFDEFEPLKIYEKTLTFRNSDAVGRRLKVLPPLNRVFSVSAPKHAGGRENAKIAPGMEVSYVVQFRPEEAVDYAYDIEFVTEREKFVVPVRGWGPQPKIQLPDHCDFGKIMACFESERTFLARNVGNKAASVTFTTEAPFLVLPSTIGLAPGDAVQVNVKCHPLHHGKVDGALMVQYGNLPPQAVSLAASVTDADITSDKSVLVCDATYVTLSAQKVFKIRNNSDIKVRFELKTNSSRQEDQDQREDELVRLDELFDQECQQLRSADLELSDESSDDEELGMSVSTAALDRKYQRLKKQAVEDPQLFKHDIFSVEPPEGWIYPGGEAEFLVTFHPAIAVEYITSVYCFVQGRATRIPVHLKGRGIGPRVCFSYAGLNLDEVYMNTAYEYKAELENRGEIEARFQLNPSTSTYGQFFNFEPETGVLQVGETREIKVSVLSNVAGSFGEDFAWTIQGSPNDLKIRFQGEFVGPEVGFDMDVLDFEHVSYGFINSKIFRLCNASPIPASWKILLDGDGQLLGKEWDIVPSSGVLLPHGKQKIQLDFVSHSLKVYDMCLKLAIDGVGDAIQTLPIMAVCEAPRVSLNPPRIDLGECFIRHPASHDLELVNNSDLPCRYEVMDQDEIQIATGTIVIDQPRGVIAPYQSLKLSVTLTNWRLGMTSLPITIAINGHDTHSVVDLTAQVAGPQLTVSHPCLLYTSPSPRDS
eukprot:TRINITY_DN14309_c0_g1_i2.p1 TRINITY_DN14309_c0_g1~~TRINITY_DN14309_c0_g1_i2.p1  ORF type:complete len:774 (+),score=193.47 TRINITY_DN14309_c0_g1_i2:174-2495(+)